jgi:hypothetical protein
MITDDNVLRIIQRTDLNGKEKMLLIYLLSKEPPPEKAKGDLGNTYTKVGMAKVGPEQVSDDLGKGFHRSAFKDLTRNLKRRGFLDVKGEKGGPANRYRVKFPQKQPKSRPATEKE